MDDWVTTPLAMYDLNECAVLVTSPQNTVYFSLLLCGDEALVLLWKRFTLCYILSLCGRFRSLSVRWRWELPDSLCNRYFSWY